MEVAIWAIEQSRQSRGEISTTIILVNVSPRADHIPRNIDKCISVLLTLQDVRIVVAHKTNDNEPECPRGYRSDGNQEPDNLRCVRRTDKMPTLPGLLEANETLVALPDQSLTQGLHPLTYRYR